MTRYITYPKISNTKLKYINTLGSTMCMNTYGKLDKQLRDRNIYNFNHKGYHKINCISKDPMYRNKWSTQRWWCIPMFTLTRVILSIGEVWRSKQPHTLRRTHRILLKPSHQKGSPRSTKGPLRAVSNLYKPRTISTTYLEAPKKSSQKPKAWEIFTT
jgi:hypothetical protein